VPVEEPLLAFALLTPPHDALHWHSTLASPVVVSVHDATGDPVWGQFLRAAASEWNAGVENVRLDVVTGNADCETGAGPFTAVACVRPTSPSTRAETRWYVGDGEHLRFATIHLDPERASAHRQRLACHELGHALGLRHRQSGSSCMTPKTDHRHPDAADYQAVTDAHAHLHLGDPPLPVPSTPRRDCSLFPGRQRPIRLRHFVPPFELKAGGGGRPYSRQQPDATWRLAIDDPAGCRPTPASGATTVA